MKTMLTSGWVHPAKAALRVALMGAACFAAIAPLEDRAVSAAVPARAVQAERLDDGSPEVAAGRRLDHARGI